MTALDLLEDILRQDWRTVDGLRDAMRDAMQAVRRELDEARQMANTWHTRATAHQQATANAEAEIAAIRQEGTNG